MSTPQVILYAYPQSPFAQKLQLVLLFKHIAYKYVEVPRIPPRTALELLGVHYRRIPVLVIGSEVYLDTSLAVLALERAFPERSLKGRSWGVQTASAFFWADRTIFPLAAGLIPWDLMSPEFRADRASYRGVGPIDPKVMEQRRPLVLSAFRSHLDLIEAQLASNTSSSSSFILDTPTPTYLDLSLFFQIRWVEGFGTAKSLYSELSSTFPLVEAWFAALKAAVDEAQQSAPKEAVTPTKISEDEAAKLIHAIATDEQATSVDDKEPLLVASWFKLGDTVEVTPTDTGKVPQQGTLIGLNKEQVVVEVVGKSGGKVRVHAPRLGFSVQKKA